jgi:hypothetical protein
MELRSNFWSGSTSACRGGNTVTSCEAISASS